MKKYRMADGCFMYKTEEVEKVVEENKLLREMLWLRHGCHGVGLYGDDGEIQCNKCIIDFKRDSVNFIEKRFIEIATKALKAYKESQKKVDEVVVRGEKRDDLV